MNRFKRPTEYPAASQPPHPGVKEITELHERLSPKVDGWECVGCAQRAVLLHRGTGYCRTCYDRRNYDGTLIG